MEGGYVKLGDIATIGTVNNTTIFTSRTRQRTDGFRLVGVGRYPLNDRFSVLGKLGVFRWDSEISLRNSIGAQTKADDDDTDITFGVGVSYTLNKNLSIGFTWDRFTNLGKASGALQTGSRPIETIDLDADVYTLGVVYRFR